MPSTFAESEAKFIKSYFGEICLETLKNNGAIVVRIQGNGKKNDQLFGVFCTKGKFISVSKEAMLNAHCTRPDGTRMEPEKNLIYTTLEEVLRREK